MAKNTKRKTVISADMQDADTMNALDWLVERYAAKIGVKPERAQSMYLRYLVRKTFSSTKKPVVVETEVSHATP